MNLAPIRVSRRSAALQAKAVNAIAAQMIQTARSKIENTDFDALPESERASAYAEAETLVAQAENIVEEASKLVAYS